MLCHAFGVLRSSYYHYRATRKSSNSDRTKLKVMIKSFFKQSRCSLGSRGMRYMLLNQGIKVGRYLVRKLMRESGLVSKQCKKHKYQSDMNETPFVPNTLNRQFKPVQPNHVWSSDITYIWTGKTWAYLAVVLDLYARRVITWSMSAQADQHLVIKALDEA